MTQLCNLSLREASRAMMNGDFSPVEYMDAHIQRIHAINPKIHAFLSIEVDAAIAEAKCLSTRRRSASSQPLFGIPFAVKDNIDVRGSRTTCQSRASIRESANRDAECVSRLRTAGGIYLGKLALYEFALGGPDFQSEWPPARNPWNVNYTPGSSSTGAGAAVAARLVPLAIGTDTGGSIRSPAMMNGIVGLKPTHGRIPMTGVFPLAPSLDTVGPLARSVSDLSIGFAAMDGKANIAHERCNAPKIGLLSHLWQGDQIPSPDVASVMERAVADLVEAGAEVTETKIQSLQRINAAGWTILYSEAFECHRSNIRRNPELYGSPVRDMLLTGAFFSANDYLVANDLRARIAASIDKALDRFDCLLTAVSGLPPCRLEDARAMTALATASVRIFCSLSGHPAVAIPAGVSADGLPIGLQIVGRKHEEEKLLATGEWIEARLSGWSMHNSPPAIPAMNNLGSG